MNVPKSSNWTDPALYHKLYRTLHQSYHWASIIQQFSRALALYNEEDHIVIQENWRQSYQ